MRRPYGRRRGPRHRRRTAVTRRAGSRCRLGPMPTLATPATAPTSSTRTRGEGPVVLLSERLARQELRAAGEASPAPGRSRGRRAPHRPGARDRPSGGDRADEPRGMRASSSICPTAQVRQAPSVTCSRSSGSRPVRRWRRRARGRPVRAGRRRRSDRRVAARRTRARGSVGRGAHERRARPRHSLCTPAGAVGARGAGASVGERRAIAGPHRCRRRRRRSRRTAAPASAAITPATPKATAPSDVGDAGGSPAAR